MAQQDGSVAPKERVNIVYKADTGNAKEEKELPLKMLVMGDFTGAADQTPLENRKPINVNKDNLEDVIASQNIALEFSVPNMLENKKEAGELPVKISISSMKDFGPEAVAKQIPELRQLLELREALSALKGPLGNMPAFRKKIQELVQDPTARTAILSELTGGKDANT
jgi:type VI secretion system protein ImpB